MIKLFIHNQPVYWLTFLIVSLLSCSFSSDIHTWSTHDKSQALFQSCIFQLALHFFHIFGVEDEKKLKKKLVKVSIYLSNLMCWIHLPGVSLPCSVLCTTSDVLFYFFYSFLFSSLSHCSLLSLRDCSALSFCYTQRSVLWTPWMLFLLE